MAAWPNSVPDSRTVLTHTFTRTFLSYICGPEMLSLVSTLTPLPPFNEVPPPLVPLLHPSLPHLSLLLVEDAKRTRFDPGSIARLLEEEFEGQQHPPYPSPHPLPLPLPPKRILTSPLHCVPVYDQDHSQTLNKAEWEHVTLYHITRKKDEIIVARSFEKADANKDSKLDAKEITAHYGKQGYTEEELDVLMILGEYYWRGWVRLYHVAVALVEE